MIHRNYMIKKTLLIAIIASVFLPYMVYADSGAVLKLEVQDYGDNSKESAPVGLSAFRFWMFGKVAVSHPPIGKKYLVASTGYAPSPYQTDSTPCITAAGTRVRDGVVATNFLPMGTIISMNNKLYIVEDRMNSRYGVGYMDIWFSSTSEALEFGRRKMEIEVVGYGVPGQDLKIEDKEDVEPGVLESLGLRFLAFGRKMSTFMRAAVSPQKNRYDVDCFEENNDKS